MIEYRFPETWIGPIPSAKKISRLVFDAGLVQLIPFVGATVFDSIYGAWSRIGVVEVALLCWSLFGGAGLLFASSAIRRRLSRRAISISIVLIAIIVGMTCTGVVSIAPAIARQGVRGAPVEVLVLIGVIYGIFAAYTLFQLWRLQNWAAQSARSLIVS